MHIVMTVLGLVGAGVFWLHRLNAAGEAVRNLSDMAGRAHGAAKRRRFRARAEESPFAAIDHPVVGAATVIIAMAQEMGRYDTTAEDRLRKALRPVAANDDLVEEALIYGKWAASQTAEASTALRHVTQYLVRTLSPAERNQLVSIAEAIIDPEDGTPGRRQQLLRSLASGLKL